MLMMLTKKQVKEQQKELIKFCKENHCLMYNHLRLIEQIRNEPKNKILEEKLRKQSRRKLKKEVNKLFHNLNNDGEIDATDLNIPQDKLDLLSEIVNKELKKITGDLK